MVKKEQIKGVFDNIGREYIVKCTPNTNPLIKGKPVIDDIVESDFNGRGVDQEDYQNKVNLENVFIKGKALKSLRDYMGAGYTYINGRIYDTDEWSSLKKENRELYDEYDKNIPSMIKDINSLIDKAPRLQEDTVLWRYGDWDVGLKVGDTGKWKGFTSTSFSEKDINQFNREGRYKIKILALKGQKGICGNGYTLEDWGGKRPVQVLLAKFKGESEYLLPTNTNYIVKEVDDANKTATVIVY